MSRSKPVIIGERHFKTQKDAFVFIKNLLNSQPLKVAIAEPEHSFLCALVSFPPHNAEKIGGGVARFTVEHAAHGTRCFYVTRNDGSKVDFSYFKCVRGRQ